MKTWESSLTSVLRDTLDHLSTRIPIANASHTPFSGHRCSPDFNNRKKEADTHDTTITTCSKRLDRDSISTKFPTDTAHLFAVDQQINNSSSSHWSLALHCSSVKSHLPHLVPLPLPSSLSPVPPSGLAHHTVQVHTLTVSVGLCVGIKPGDPPPRGPLGCVLLLECLADLNDIRLLSCRCCCCCRRRRPIG